MLSINDIAQRSKLPAIVVVAALFLLFHYHGASYALLPNTATTRASIQNPLANSKPTNNYAFSAFLAAPSMDTKDDNDDLYFVGTRMLIYQLLHDPETRTNNSYPFVVLATQDVAERKLDRLRKDGATVIVVEKLSLEWAKTRKAWQDVLTKLRLFALYQYDRLLFLDSDTLITRRMDGIFDDPATQVQTNLGDPAKMMADEGPQPETYVFAGNAGSGGFEHKYPPTVQGDNLNAGCMVIRPAQDLFDYYMALAKIPDRYPGRTPEQSLWMYAHQRKGNMPWKQLHYEWNINWATYQDKVNGVASLHSKFWELDHDQKLRDYAMRIRWRMEGHWEAIETLK